MENTKKLQGYEYKNVVVQTKTENFWKDGYEALGWKVEKAARRFRNGHGANLDYGGAGRNQFQDAFEQGAKEIEKMECSRTAGASAGAYAARLLGTVFMGASVFAYLYGILPVSIALAIPGFAGWGISFAVYHTMKKKRNQKGDLLVDEKQEELTKVLEKAQKFAK